MRSGEHGGLGRHESTMRAAKSDDGSGRSMVLPIRTTKAEHAVGEDESKRLGQ
jgi:hypothetical protein